MKMRRHQPEFVLRWTFRRGNELLTCLVHWQHGALCVSLVPHGAGSASAVYTFSTLFGALQQHAAIAAALREDGWSVVGYGVTPQTPERRPLRGVVAA